MQCFQMGLWPSALVAHNASDTPLNPYPMLVFQFRFCLDKVISALAYFADQGVGDLTKLKAAKLLYLADRHHLFSYGRPITGDRYIAMDLGPVPEGAFQLISRIMEPVEVEDPARAQALGQLDVVRGAGYPHAVLRARTKPDLDVFSESEVQSLAAVVEEFGQVRAKQLVDLTHEHAAYRRADAGRCQGSSVDLPYEYFFDDAPDNLMAVRGLAEGEQEDRDFASALERAGRAALAAPKP